MLNDESNSQFKTNEEDLSINTNLSSLDSGEITDKNSDQSDAEVIKVAINYNLIKL